MIQKIKWDEQPEDAAKEVQNLIDQLVDAVNELQKAFESIHPCLKYKELNKAPTDPYAEQRRWIGKLCWFSNGDGFDEVGYLTEIDPDMPEAKFRCNCHDYYAECKPVKPTDSIIYKGE